MRICGFAAAGERMRRLCTMSRSLRRLARPPNRPARYAPGVQSARAAALRPREPLCNLHHTGATSLFSAGMIRHRARLSGVIAVGPLTRGLFGHRVISCSGRRWSQLILFHGRAFIRKHEISGTGKKLRHARRISPRCATWRPNSA